MANDFDLVCIGSGPAGQRAAVQGAKLGKRTAIIERRICVGGVCLETGTIPSKTFREAALSLSAAGDVLAGHGLRRAMPTPTAAQLLSRVGEVVKREADVLDHQLRRNGVEVLTGCGAFVDPHTLRVGSDEEGWQDITADNIVIAVGTRPTSPPGISPDGDSVLTSDDISAMARLPRTLTVVGAGVIGIEYASIFATLGTKVTVVDRRERPLEFLDHEIVDELMHQMREHGVLFRGGESVASITRVEGNTARVATELESGKRILSEAVLFSVGRMGATDDLALEKAGLKADDRGRLAVDDQFRTSVAHIYAAGDVIGYPSLAATSSEQGRLAACHALGVSVRPMAPHFPIGIYSVPEVGMVGKPEHELTKDKIPYEVGVARYREIARGQILGDETGYFKMLFHRVDRRLLGVHIIGTGATELLHIGQAVIGLGGGLDYFLETVFNYPTLAECYKVAALNAANRMAA